MGNPESENTTGIIRYWGDAFELGWMDAHKAVDAIMKGNGILAIRIPWTATVFPESITEKGFSQDYAQGWEKGIRSSVEFFLRTNYPL